MAETILVADDEGAARSALQHSGYQVVDATDGREVLEKVKIDPPAMVVCSVQMPRVDGLEVARRLKADPGTRSIPLVLINGSPADPDVHAGWTSGADCYLTRPLDAVQFQDFVTRLLRRASAAQG